MKNFTADEIETFARDLVNANSAEFGHPGWDEDYPEAWKDAARTRVRTILGYPTTISLLATAYDQGYNAHANADDGPNPYRRIA